MGSSATKLTSGMANKGGAVSTNSTAINVSGSGSANPGGIGGANPPAASSTAGSGGSGGSNSSAASSSAGSGGSRGTNSSAATLLIAEKEIENLLWIEDDPKCQTALREWDRKEAYLSSKVDRKEKRSADVTNQIFNIVGFFSVFQGVVLTAVSQLHSDTESLCGKVWVPFVLSVVAAGVTVISIWMKFVTLEELETSIHSDKITQRAVARRATLLRSEGRNFSFHTHASDHEGRNSNSWVSNSRIAVIVSLVILTGLFITSDFVILCDSLEFRPWKHGL